MALYVGRGAAIGVGEETTWGTAAARTHWMQPISESLMRKVGKAGRPNLGLTGVPGRRRHYISDDMAGGDVELELLLEGQGIWLKHALGTLAESGAGDPYTHTYTQSSQLDAGTGLTIERIVGTDTAAGATRAEVFEGCKIATLGIKIALGDIARMTCGIIAETSSTRAAGGSPTFTTNDYPILFNQAGNFSWNSVNYASVKSMDLSHDNKLATRQRFGATTTKEPVRVDFTETKIRLTMDLENDNLITALTADTAADLTVTFTNAANRTIAFTLTGAYISDYSDSTSGPGLLEASVEFTGQYDGTTNPLKIVIVNSQSTGILA